MRHLLHLMLTTAFFAGPAAAGTLVIQPRSVEDLKAVFATVESVHTTVARVRNAGTIAAIKVVEGDRVKAGQIVAQVEDPKLVMEAAANDARQHSLEAQRRQAELELDRARQLRASGAGAQSRLDDAQAALDVVKGQIAALEAEQQVVEQRKREGAVLAPTAGRVLKVQVVDGAVVMPGEIAATIATENYVMRLRLPERHARFIKPGDPVLVGDRGLAPAESVGALRSGTVRLVYPELSSGQVVADAVVSDLGDYYVGERVRVYVGTGRREAMVLPRDYLVRRFGVDFAKLDDGREVPVQTGGEIPDVAGSAGGIEVLSGLKAGDRIVTP